MKPLILALLLAAAVPAAAAGGTDKSLGVGIMLGSPTGATAKYWLAPTRALDLGLGTDGEFEFHADYLLHAFDVFPKSPDTRIGAYAGLGGAVTSRHESGGLALRIPVGVTFLPVRYAVEFYFELVPTVEVTPDSHTDMDFGLGGRFYFGR